MIKIGVNGACGRMGARIIALALRDKDFSVTQAIEREGHPDLGKDIGLLTGCQELGVKITDSINGKVDVLIDFSSPLSTIKRLNECAERGIAIVIGTTGFNDEQKEKLTLAAKKIPCLFSPNMSVGVNLLFDIISQVARILGKEADIEIIETHHRFKKDAPSGTALKIAEKICEATGIKMDKDVVYGRYGEVGERKQNQIAIHAVRLGNVVGIHKVIFDSQEEQLEITHNAHSRDTFASGALKAARFIAGCPPGLYTMSDVLNKHL